MIIKQKKILVTGGLGFIGTNFILQLQNQTDLEIVNVDYESYASNTKINEIFQTNGNYKFIKADIADKEAVDEIMNSEKPSAIVNFAAESHVDKSIVSSEQFIMSNIIGTFNLLESFRNFYDLMHDRSQKDLRFLHVSTDEVYGSLQSDGLFTENSPYDPSSPYSASKASSDHLVMAWYRTYNLPVMITNCSNNYGPYQHSEKLIPTIIRSCLQKTPIPVYGDGKNVRDWIHVTDHVRAILSVLENGKIGNKYNIGSLNERQNIEIVKLICDIFQSISPLYNITYRDLITFVQDRKGHDFRYAIDIDKITKEINWKPRIDFNNGLKSTIEWYISNEQFLN